MAINDQVRTDWGTIRDVSEGRDESLADISATKLLGDDLPSSPSDGEVLRFNGSSGAWEHGRELDMVRVTGDNSTRATKATAVQDAVNTAVSEGAAHVFVPESFTNYDASAVTFDDSVRMVREGQQADGLHVEAYGAPSDETTDAIDAIQAAINQCPEGDTVLLGPRQYTCSAPPSITKQITLKGRGVYTPKSAIQRNFVGSHFHVTGDGVNGLEITVQNKAVNLRGFGIEFDAALTNPGHGILATAPADGAGRFEHGLSNARWSDIAVAGHGEDSYAYRILNPQLCLFGHCRWGPGTEDIGGGFEFEANHASINMGNCMVLFPVGTSGGGATDTHAFHFIADNTAMNFIRLVGPDIRMQGENNGENFIDFTELNGGNVRNNGSMLGNWERDNTNTVFNLVGAGAFYPMSIPNDDDVFTTADIVGSWGPDGSGSRIKGNSLSSRTIQAGQRFWASGNSKFSQGVAATVTTVTVNLNGNVGSTTYAVTLNTDWITDYRVFNRTVTTFDVEFGTAVPAGGGTVQGHVVITN